MPLGADPDLTHEETEVHTWAELAEHFRKVAGNNADRLNNKALGDICAYMGSSPHGARLKPSDVDTNSVYMQQSNGSNPGRRLKVEAIIGNRLEFCLSDREAGTSHYFMPHADHTKALQRFREIVGAIDWSAPVLQDRPRSFWAQLKELFR
jgi:hypothetical protein